MSTRLEVTLVRATGLKHTGTHCIEIMLDGHDKIRTPWVDDDYDISGNASTEKYFGKAGEGIAFTLKGGVEQYKTRWLRIAVIHQRMIGFSEKRAAEGHLPFEQVAQNYQGWVMLEHKSKFSGKVHVVCKLSERKPAAPKPVENLHVSDAELAEQHAIWASIKRANAGKEKPSQDQPGTISATVPSTTPTSVSTETKKKAKSSKPTSRGVTVADPYSFGGFGDSFGASGDAFGGFGTDASTFSNTAAFSSGFGTADFGGVGGAIDKDQPAGWSSADFGGFGTGFVENNTTPTEAPGDFGGSSSGGLREKAPQDQDSSDDDLGDTPIHSDGGSSSNASPIVALAETSREPPLLGLPPLHESDQVFQPCSRDLSLPQEALPLTTQVPTHQQQSPSAEKLPSTQQAPLPPLPPLPPWAEWRQFLADFGDAAVERAPASSASAVAVTGPINVAVDSQPPEPTGRRKALLIGANYLYAPAQLAASHADVERVRSTLLRVGFLEEHIICLRDGVPDLSLLPTKRNILTGLRWLAHGAAPGDALFFHFSGHGSQVVETKVASTGEKVEDVVDDAICPVDLQWAGHVTDHQIFECIVRHLPSGVRLTALLDCCVPGPSLNLPWSCDDKLGWIEGVDPYHTLGDAICFSLRQGVDASGQPQDLSADQLRSLSARSGGSLTTAFLKALGNLAAQCQAKGSATYMEFTAQVREELRADAIPFELLVTASQAFDPTKRRFRFGDACPNGNAVIGLRAPRRAKPPRKWCGAAGVDSALRLPPAVGPPPPYRGAAPDVSPAQAAAMAAGGGASLGQQAPNGNH